MVPPHLIDLRSIHFMPTIIGCPDNAGLAELATHLITDQLITGFTTRLKSELPRCSFDRGLQSLAPNPCRTIDRVLFSVIAYACIIRILSELSRQRAYG